MCNNFIELGLYKMLASIIGFPVLAAQDDCIAGKQDIPMLEEILFNLPSGLVGQQDACWHINVFVNIVEIIINNAYIYCQCHPNWSPYSSIRTGIREYRDNRSEMRSR